MQRQVGTAHRAHQHSPPMTTVNLHHHETVAGHRLQRVGDRLLRMPTHTHHVVSIQRMLQVANTSRDRSARASYGAAVPPSARQAVFDACQDTTPSRLHWYKRSTAHHPPFTQRSALLRAHNTLLG